MLKVEGLFRDRLCLIAARRPIRKTLMQGSDSSVHCLAETKEFGDRWTETIALPELVITWAKKVVAYFGKAGGQVRFFCSLPGRGSC
jgi:hypothetical protein